MREFRLKALEYFLARPMPSGALRLLEEGRLRRHPLLRALLGEGQADWDEVPADVKKTFDRLGIPRPSRSSSPASALSTSRRSSTQGPRGPRGPGRALLDMDSGLREHEDIVREYFATVIPPNDNKLAALNSAVWSGGSFVYVPAAST